MRDQLRKAFENLKDGIRELQSAATRGDMNAIEHSLPECLAAVEELEAAMLAIVPES